LKVRKYKIFKMKNLFIGLMLLTASFSFANSEVVVKNVEVVLPVTTVVVANAEQSDDDTCSITVTCYRDGASCSGTGTADNCNTAWFLAFVNMCCE
jgi:hypothetical protein